jgi:hypothetical protein
MSLVNVGSVSNQFESTIVELTRKLEFYESAGIFTLDCRRFMESGNPILSEVAAIQTKIEQANRQYDLDSLPLCESDLEEAKSKVRIAREKIHAHKATEVEVLRRASATHDGYQNAVNQLMDLQRIELDPYASKADVNEHQRKIANAQSEVHRREAAMSDIYLDQSNYRQTFAQLTAAYNAAVAHCNHCQRLYNAVAKRLGIETDSKPKPQNELGFTS